MCAAKHVSGNSVMSHVEAHTIEEESSRLIVRCNTLQKSQRIADAVGGCSGELRWVEQSINGYNLLQQGSHHAFVMSQ